MTATDNPAALTRDEFAPLLESLLEQLTLDQCVYLWSVTGASGGYIEAWSDGLVIADVLGQRREFSAADFKIATHERTIERARLPLLAQLFNDLSEDQYAVLYGATGKERVVIVPRREVAE